MAKLIQVIEADELVGNGTPDSPYLRNTVYFSTDGERLATRWVWCCATADWVESFNHTTPISKLDALHLIERKKV